MRARACGGTPGGSRSSSGSSILHSLAKNITVVVRLAHQAIGEFGDGLFLCETVDAAVGVVFDWAVAFAAGVEDGGHIAGDFGGAGCVRNGELVDGCATDGRCGEGGGCCGAHFDGLVG